MFPSTLRLFANYWHNKSMIVAFKVKTHDPYVAHLCKNKYSIESIVQRVKTRRS